VQEDIEDHLLQKNKCTLHLTKHSDILEEVQEVQEVQDNLQEELVHHKTSYQQHPM
jgi:hypothetical protein